MFKMCFLFVKNTIIFNFAFEYANDVVENQEKQEFNGTQQLLLQADYINFVITFIYACS